MDGFVSLRITGDGLDIQEITSNLGYSPSTSYKKGGIYESKYERVVYTEDGWLADGRKKEDETLEECIEQFISEFYRVANYLKTLASKFDVRIWIEAYPEGEQSNIHLSEKTIHAIKEMGASIDVNVMFLKEFYDGTYKNKIK